MQLRIREEIARARRDEHPLGAVILDLDDFKGVNDTHGHAAGDELLRKVARALQGELRPYDQVARYGGDEFVLLLPGSDEATTAAVAERCRDAIGGKCSIGVAAWHDGLDANGLLEQADRALMLAKRTGKGRVAVANPEVERELALLQSRSGSPAAVQALAAAIEERDNYTHAHSEQLVRLARGVAMMLGLAVERRRADRATPRCCTTSASSRCPPSCSAQAGPADRRGVGGHVRAPDRRRAHPGPHQGARRRRPDRPPRARALGRHRLSRRAGRAANPDRLARVHACHAYIAMTTPRPYRPALSVPEVVAQLQAEAGSKYDPEVVEALLDLLGRTPEVPDRAAGVKLAAPPPRAPSGRRSLRSGWAPGE